MQQQYDLLPTAEVQQPHQFQIANPYFTGISLLHPKESLKKYSHVRLINMMKQVETMQVIRKEI